MSSIYDDVKAAAGDGPAYPKRSDFTTIYGYKAGKSLGTFADVAAANAAGAASTEKNVDEVAFKAAQDAYRAHNQKITDTWMERVRAEYPSTSQAIFDIAYGAAYERGHSYGYSEVENHIGDYIDLGEKFIAASKEPEAQTPEPARKFGVRRGQRPQA